MNFYKTLIFGVSLFAMAGAYAVTDDDNNNSRSVGHYQQTEISSNCSWSEFIKNKVQMIQTNGLSPEKKIKLLKAVDPDNFEEYDFSIRYSNKLNTLNNIRIVFSIWNSLSAIEKGLFTSAFKYRQAIIFGEKPWFYVGTHEILYPMTSKVKAVLNGKSAFDNFMSMFTKQNQITELDISSKDRLSGEEVTAFSKFLAQNSSLKSLKIAIMWDSGDSAAKYLASALEKNNTLESLAMPYTGIMFEGAFSIAIMLSQSKTLKALDIRGCSEITDGGAIAVSIALPNNKILKSLNISRCDLTKNGHSAILKSLNNNSTITEFSISFKSFDKEDAKLLASILPRMASLSIIGPNDPTNTPIILEALSRATSLKSLTMRGFGINDEMCGTIADFLKNHPTMVELNISYNPFTTIGTKKITDALENNSTVLQELTLPYDATPHQLTGHLPEKTIKKIKIDTW